MAQSYTNLIYHIVFSTKNRESIIIELMKSRLKEQIGGTLRKLNGDNIMKITFPARYRYRCFISLDEAESLEVIKKVFESLKWQYSPVGECRFLVKIPFNFWSFGENIEVELLNKELSISSECVNPFQCFDWGKNRKNINILLKEFEKYTINLLITEENQTVASFNEQGFSPVERVFTEAE